MKGADLTNANLAGAKLNEANLDEAQLTEANFYNTEVALGFTISSS